jgi:hypothetical protein
MYVARVPNRNSPPAFLLREAWREGGKVKNRTLANISHWPPEQIEALRQVLKGNTKPTANPQGAFEIVRSRPHGHVAAVLAMMRQLKLDQLLQDEPPRARVLALIAQRVLQPASKLATARALRRETAHSTLGEELGVEAVDEDDLYEALDWLLPQQPALEAALARRHLGEGTLVLYDVSSTYFEGHCCPLARTAIRAMSGAAIRRLSSGCWPTVRAARWRWRCSRATPPTPRPWPPRLPSCASALN